MDLTYAISIEIGFLESIFFFFLLFIADFKLLMFNNNTEILKPGSSLASYLLISK